MFGKEILVVAGLVLDYTKKVFVIPVLEDIIEHHNNKWIDTVPNERFLEIWTQLEEFQQPEMQRNWNWDSDYKGSKKLEALIEKVEGNP